RSADPGPLSGPGEAADTAGALGAPGCTTTSTARSGASSPTRPGSADTRTSPLLARPERRADGHRAVEDDRDRQRQRPQRPEPVRADSRDVGEPEERARGAGEEGKDDEGEQDVGAMKLREGRPGDHPPDRPEVLVLAEALDLAAAVLEADPAAGALHGAPEVDVVDHLAADLVEARGATAEEDAAAGSGRPHVREPRRVEQVEEEDERRDQELLPPRAAVEEGHAAVQREAVSLG